MNAQCIAFYGTAHSQRDCLTTPKSSEGDGMHSAFLYWNTDSFVVLRDRVLLIINNRILTLTFTARVGQLRKPSGGKYLFSENNNARAGKSAVRLHGRINSMGMLHKAGSVFGLYIRILIV